MRLPGRTRTIVAVACVGLWFKATGVAQQEPAALADRAREHFYNLEFNQAVEELRAAVESSQTNPALYNDLAHTLFYRELFQADFLDSTLATGDTPLLKRPELSPPQEILSEINSSLEKAFTLSRESLAKTPKDTRALYELGVSYATRASMHFFVEKAWMKGLRDVATARQLHGEVGRLDPDFTDAALTRGAHDYLISQLPLGYKIAGSILDFRGNKKRGIATIEMVARTGRLRDVTAQILLIAIYRREHQPELAVPLLRELMARYPRNYLFPLELAQMYADAGDMAMSMATLDAVENQVMVGKPGFTRITVPRIGFHRGDILFRHGEHSRADETLLAIVDPAGTTQPEIAALAWLRLGQIRDLWGKRSKAIAAYQKSILSQPISDAARESRLLLLSPYEEEKDRRARE